MNNVADITFANAIALLIVAIAAVVAARKLLPASLWRKLGIGRIAASSSCGDCKGCSDAANKTPPG